MCTVCLHCSLVCVLAWLAVNVTTRHHGSRGVVCCTQCAASSPPAGPARAADTVALQEGVCSEGVDTVICLREVKNVCAVHQCAPSEHSNLKARG